MILMEDVTGQKLQNKAGRWSHQHLKKRDIQYGPEHALHNTDHIYNSICQSKLTDSVSYKQKTV